MADENKGRDTRSASFQATQDAFNALTADEKLAFLMENMLNAAVGGVQKATDVFTEAMEEAIRTARRACAEDERPTPGAENNRAAPNAAEDARPEPDEKEA